MQEEIMAKIRRAGLGSIWKKGILSSLEEGGPAENSKFGL